MARRKRSPSPSELSSSSSSDSEDSQPTRKHPTKQKKQRSSKSDDEKQKPEKKESKSDLHEEYLAAARCITRCVDMFCKIDKVIDVGTLLKQRELADSGDLSEDDDDAAHREKQLSKLSQKTWDRYRQNYKRLLELAPGLKPLIAGSKDPKKASQLRKIIRKMESVISGTCSDDSTRLKIPICDYVAPNPAEKAVVPPLHDGSSGRRTHLGVNHPVLARFLCPIGEIENFNEDPTSTIERLQSGKIRMEADAFPAFLWNGDLPGGNYDPDNMMDGFLDGFVLKRTMKHIFTGPSTAYGAQSRGTRPSNAALHAMTTVEPPHIAYGCVQVRFGISSRNTWTEEDGDFNYRDFYRYIIELIDDLPDDDKERLLKHWNLKLFKNEDGRDVAKDDADELGPSGARKGGSDLARLRAQMAARNAAAKTHATDSERPAAPLHRPLPTQENLPPPPRTPQPSSPVAGIPKPAAPSTPPPPGTPPPSSLVRSIPRPRPIPRSMRPAVSSPLAARENLPAPPPPPPPPPSAPAPRPASPPAKAVSQANGNSPGSELTASDEEEEPQPKPKKRKTAPAKRAKGKSKGPVVEASDDESELPTRSGKRKAAVPTRSQPAKKKQKK
ncbi:uncharacterized protein HD556DRAFT_1446512 [Suillus plorans]|uniref:Uncharacterized protein n=1 Tax=Suillus plorans TaxID=116603 RepID=A0A9P7AI10_9AGAM|nr:uncharacterized protein HD556DRAFT_1446512 [Suillus plorans]KAG1789935.1 hypothetical protein HD556DRAFT_1446512 [Suillus plorans]